jgi:hypothetical protein
LWATALSATACGGNLTSGGFGEAVVAVSGDAPEPTGVPAPVRALGAPTLASGSDDSPEGQLEADFLLFLEAADGSSVPLSDEPIEVRVDLRGRQEADAASATVPAARYEALRIVFTDIKVEVEAGLIIDGTPILGEVRVELRDGALTVERPLQLDIQDGDRVDLLIDLNAATWLQAVDPDLRTVAEGVAETAIEVVVR